MKPSDVIAAVVSVLGIVAVVVYGVQRYAYERFYEPFGITPEDIGIDAQRILSQTGFGLAIIAVVCLALAFLLLDRATAETPLLKLGKPNWKSAGTYAAIVVGLAMAWPIPVYLVSADNAGRCAAREKGGEAVRFLHVHYLPIIAPRVTLLGVRAEPATLQWIKAHRKESIVYLGENEGRVFAYKRATGKVMRVPAGDVTVTTDKHSETWDVGDTCGESQSASSMKPRG